MRAAELRGQAALAELEVLAVLPQQLAHAAINKIVLRPCTHSGCRLCSCSCAPRLGACSGALVLAPASLPRRRPESVISGPRGMIRGLATPKGPDAAPVIPVTRPASRFSLSASS